MFGDNWEGVTKNFVLKCTVDDQNNEPQEIEIAIEEGEEFTFDLPDDVIIEASFSRNDSII